MNWKRLKWKLRYAWQYFPFTLNTLICGAAIWGAVKLLYNPPVKGEVPSPFLPFIIIMGKVVLWFVVTMVIISIISTIFSFVYYQIIRADKGSRLQVEFTTEARQGKKNKLFLHARLDGAIRPMLGFVKGRLFYDDNQMTGMFSLMSAKRKEQSIWRVAITGRSRLELPDIKEYELKGGFIFFQDMLHIFSLASAQSVTGHFYQPPVLMYEDGTEVQPKKTETMDVRIEQMRRVEGELLNYKDFEAGDDVRRIVWKVYARNRELVVRVPELFEPYASHLYFYASFYAAVKNQWLGEGYLKEMLNYFKNYVWTIYDTLSRKEWEMRYVPDLVFNLPEQMPDDERAARIISNSEWHKETSLEHYFNVRNGTVLCISSLTDVAELANILDRSDAATVVYFVKLSNALKHFAPLNLVSRLLLRPPKDRLSRLKTTWTFSPIRLQVQRREREIEKLLNKSHVTWTAL